MTDNQIFLHLYFTYPDPDISDCTISRGFNSQLLLLPEIDLNWHSGKIKILTNLIFNIPPVWITYVLGQIGKQCKSRSI